MMTMVYFGLLSPLAKMRMLDISALENFPSLCVLYQGVIGLEISVS